MPEDGPRVTRRQLLAGAGGIGAFGVLGGTGSSASLTDDETLAGKVAVGEVDVEVGCADCTVVSGGVQVRFDTIEPGDQRTRRIHLGVSDESNPVRLWLRTGCPPAVDPLGEALEARLSVVHKCESEDSDRTFPHGSDWLAFDEFRRALHDGERIDGGHCLRAGDEVCLDVEYRLPGDATWAVDAQSDLRLALFAQQCRHVPAADVEEPFPDESCPDLACADCIELGKLDVAGDRLTPDTTYRFDELSAPFDADGHEYALDVLTVTDKVGEGERETVCASVRVLRDGSERDAPPLCDVAVGGGVPGGKTPGRGKHTGKSKQNPPRQSGQKQGGPSGPDSRRVRYEVAPPLTRTRGEVCAAHDKDAPESEPDGRRPAISNVTVYVCRGGEGESDASTEVSDGGTS